MITLEFKAETKEEMITKISAWCEHNDITDIQVTGGRIIEKLKHKIENQSFDYVHRDVLKSMINYCSSPNARMSTPLTSIQGVHKLLKFEPKEGSKFIEIIK